MLEIEGASVVYQAQTKLADLAFEVAEIRNYKKPEAQAKIRQGFNIYKSLQALSYEVFLTRAQKEKIWYCLIKQAGINDFPEAPTITPQSPPTILVGIPGPEGDPGPRGEDGGATDFGVFGVGSDIVVDSFLSTDAFSARWDYVLYDGSGNRRSGTVICDWSSDGSNVSDSSQFSNIGSGNTDAVTFNVDFSAGRIRLLAIITDGNWTIVGSRYFIPNNGAGTGIINTNLPNGQIFVGNASNIAVAVTPSQDLSVSNTGVFTLTPGVIVNATISGTAAIAFSKMAALTASKIVVTDGSGIITTTSSPSLTELGYLSGVTSGIQTQLDSKVGSITGAISTVVSSNLTADKVLVSNPSGKIAIGAASTTEVGYLVGVTSAIQTQINTKLTNVLTTAGDLIIRNGANTTVRLPIGSAGTFLGSDGTVASWQSVPGTTATGGTKRAAQGLISTSYTLLSGKTYGSVSFTTAVEPVWKIAVNFYVQISGDGGGFDRVQFTVQRSLNNSTWTNSTEIPQCTYSTDNGSNTSVNISGVDTTVSPSTTYFYRLVGSTVFGGSSFYSDNIGYLLNLVPA